MKFLTVIALLSLSVSSFAGRLIKAGGSCNSTVDPSISVSAQQAEVTRCAENEALKALNARCSGANYYLSSESIAQRTVKSSNGAYGRTIIVSATAVGSCEFSQF